MGARARAGNEEGTGVEFNRVDSRPRARRLIFGAVLNILPCLPRDTPPQGQPLRAFAACQGERCRDWFPIFVVQQYPYTSPSYLPTYGSQKAWSDVAETPDNCDSNSKVKVRVKVRGQRQTSRNFKHWTPQIWRLDQADSHPLFFLRLAPCALVFCLSTSTSTPTSTSTSA